METPPVILDTPKQIALARLATLKSGLKLEMRGLKLSRGTSCYSILRKEYGFKGNREKVLAQVEKTIQTALNSNGN